MGSVFFVNFFLLIQCLVSPQSNIYTIPDTEDGRVYIAVSEGEINTTVVCRAFTSPSNQFQTPWRIQRQGEDANLMILGFNPNGQPMDN